MIGMEEKLREDIRNAFGQIHLDNERKMLGQRNLLSKAQGRQKAEKTWMAAGIIVAAAVFLVVNGILIGMNLTHVGNVPVTEPEYHTQPSETDALTKYPMSELLNGVESLLIEYDGQQFKDGGDSEEIKEFSGQITITNLVGNLSGDSILKITINHGSPDECAVEIFNNQTVSLNGIRYKAYISEKAYTMLWDYKRKYFEEGQPNQIMGLVEQISDEEDLNRLSANPFIYVEKFSEGFYAAAACYDNGVLCTPQGGVATGIRYRYYKTENELVTEYSMNLDAQNEKNGIFGACYMDGDWFEVAKLENQEGYRIRCITSMERSNYAQDVEGKEIETFLRLNTQYFIRLTDNRICIEDFREDSGEKKDPSSYCSLHGWDEQCTENMKVRDIYVAQNWIGKNVNDFAALESFFDETATVWFEDGNLFQTEESERNAYQINTSFSTLRFEVSTEADDNEIISVTLYGDHNYVTEDVWLGMNMEDVKKIMNIDDSAFFEKDGTLFSFFEKDGYLYEFSYRSMAGGNYWLYLSCVSNAAKIKDSTVKSFGEQMEEGRNIFAQ